MRKKKINKRTIQAAETKSKIYKTARSLFLQHGFEKVSVDSIVSAAGVSKGSFYVHFQSKDALASILINDYVNEIDLDYSIYLEDVGDEVPASDVLILMTKKVAEVIDNKIGYENIKTLYKSHITKAIDTDYAMSYSRELYKMFGDILEKGFRQGEFRSDIPVNTLANHIILAMRGITFEWCIRSPDFDLKEQFLEHVEILLKGIIKR